MIRTKKEMYSLLNSGHLGNTVPMWFDIPTWKAAPVHRRFSQWGVRTMAPGGPCKLFVHRKDVEGVFQSFTSQGHTPQISPMVDTVANVTLWADIWDGVTGVEVSGIEYPPKGASWRELMPVASRRWVGTAAKLLLERHLSPDSLDDLRVIFERFPGHVCELSALDRHLGTCPGRNAVVWEVRAY